MLLSATKPLASSRDLFNSRFHDLWQNCSENIAQQWLTFTCMDPALTAGLCLSEHQTHSNHSYSYSEFVMQMVFGCIRFSFHLVHPFVLDFKNHFEVYRRLPLTEPTVSGIAKVKPYHLHQNKKKVRFHQKLPSSQPFNHNLMIIIDYLTAFHSCSAAVASPDIQTGLWSS